MSNIPFSQQGYSGSVSFKSRWDELTDVTFTPTKGTYYGAGSAQPLYQCMHASAKCQDSASSAPVLPDSDALVEMLKNHELLITATKANGGTMVLRCTLKAELLPQLKHSIPSLAQVVLAPNPLAVVNGIKPKDPNHITVWCTDRQAWRSFRYERLIQVESVDPTT